MPPPILDLLPVSPATLVAVLAPMPRLVRMPDNGVSEVPPDVWLRADDVVTFNGYINDLISQANDKTGNGYHYTQGSGEGWPLYVASVLNGRAAMLFNVGTDQAPDYLIHTSAVAWSQPFTIITVWAHDGSVPFGQTHYAVDNSGDLGGVSVAENGSGQIRLHAGAQLLATGAGGAQIVTVVVNGASSIIRVNGTEVATGNAGASTITNLKLCRTTAFQQWIGYIFEHRIYLQELDSAEMLLIERAMGVYYGITTP